MIDPVANFINALRLILRALPTPYINFFGLVTVFAVIFIIIKIVRAL